MFGGSRRGLLRVLLAVAALTAFAGAAAMVALPAAAAAPGTWGAGHYRYLDGTVCASGAGTSPLAAWGVAGGHRGYLTRSLTSAGGVDSGAPPIPSAGTPLPSADVRPGPEFPSESAIAIYAYLLSSGGDPSAVAAAVLDETDAGHLPSCADSRAASELVATAQAHAGPYQLTVTTPPGTAHSGRPLPVSAIVVGGSGLPVPGVRVSFAAPGATFSGSAVTGPDGIAHSTMTIGPGSSTTLTVSATAAVAVGLREATIVARPSPTNPRRASVPAVYAAPPADFTGRATVAVDRTPHPVISSDLPSPLVRVGTGFTPTAAVSGLNGHAADVSFDLLGPVPVRPRTLCDRVPASAWSGPHARIADHTTSTLVGDGRARGGPFTPSADGCYAVRVTVTTTDTTPAVTRHAPAMPVAALKVALQSLDTAPSVLAPGADALTGSVQVGATYGLPGTLSLALRGPITPSDGDCAATSPRWHKAPSQTVHAKVAGGTTSGRLTYAAKAPKQLGCYRAHPVLTLTYGDGTRLTVPAGSTERPVYVLHPTVTAAVQRTWAVSPAPVPVQVTVDGLYGLPAHVRMLMYARPSVPTGCANATFTSATAAGAGPAAVVPATPAAPAGAVTVDVTSGPTPRIGCYSVVPELTVDANPKISAAGRPGLAGTTLIAGIDPNQHSRPTSRHASSGTGIAFLVTVSCLVTVLLAVLSRVALLAWRERESTNRLPPGGGLGLLS